MKRDAKDQMRQTATEYAEEIRRWGRYSEDHIQEAVAYALERGTVLPDDPEAAEAPESGGITKKSEELTTK